MKSPISYRTCPDTPDFQPAPIQPGQQCWCIFWEHPEDGAESVILTHLARLVPWLENVEQAWNVPGLFSADLRKSLEADGDIDTLALTIAWENDRFVQRDEASGITLRIMVTEADGGRDDEGVPLDADGVPLDAGGDEPPPPAPQAPQAPQVPS